jgi:hypothetical protein
MKNPLRKERTKMQEKTSTETPVNPMPVHAECQTCAHLDACHKATKDLLQIHGGGCADRLSTVQVTCAGCGSVCDEYLTERENDKVICRGCFETRDGPSAQMPAPTAPVAPSGRERLKGTFVPCPRCKKDAFVIGTRTHPKFIQNRSRRYRCGTCGHNFKTSI